MSTAGPKTRRDPRVSSQGLDLHYRGTAGEWRSAKVVDLSLGGSLIACAVDPDVFMGCKLALIIERRSDGARVEVSAEVLRVSDREGAGRRAALRFIELSQRSAATLATVLSEPIDDGGEQPEGDDGSDGEGEGGPVTEIIGPMVGGQPLTTLRMHKCSLYELLSIDPACDENTLAGHGEALIFTVTDELQRAVGRREQRLQVLFNSVVRMRPLWNDQIKRA
ncbi:MAG TPA: PilZ domain-containing protein, partial [Myxococcota bacterium]